MPRESHAEKRLVERELRFDKEYRMKVKRSEENEALEEVFDKSTLMLIYGMQNKGVLSEIEGIISAGKESRVYLGKTGKGDVAVKIYLTGSAEFRKGMMPYIAGDRRFENAKRGDTRSLMTLWARKEFANLREFGRAGVAVPEPIHVEGNVLVMSFIGEGGVRAPLLNEIELPDPALTYEQLTRFVRLMVKGAGLIHGDLSEFNVMMFKDRPVVIDVSQSVLLSHPLARELLVRDMSNINRFFSGLGARVVGDEFLEELMGTETS